MPTDDVPGDDPADAPSGVPSNVAVWLDTLAGSHDRLSELVSELDDDELAGPSYCDDWTIAQVLSHIGSGAEILGKNVDAVVVGEPPPARESFPSIWARWNSMATEELREASLGTDGQLVGKLEHLGDDLDSLEFTLFGAIRVDAVGLIGMRLSEHALHTWDIAVALDPKARVDGDAVALLVGRLPISIGYMAKPDRADVDRPFTVRIVTSDPTRELDLVVGDTVTLTPSEGAALAQSLHLPAEAFVRLVYGRLDPDHAPGVEPDEVAVLDTLRLVFPGF